VTESAGVDFGAVLSQFDNTVRLRSVCGCAVSAAAQCLRLRSVCGCAPLAESVLVTRSSRTIIACESLIPAHRAETQQTPTVDKQRLTNTLLSHLTVTN